MSGECGRVAAVQLNFAGTVAHRRSRAYLATRQRPAHALVLLPQAVREGLGARHAFPVATARAIRRASPDPKGFQHVGSLRVASPSRWQIGWSYRPEGP